ncbi:MAG: aspartyl-tRNA synthetase [Verrucomicrobia bacterium]|nr:aspartyl-tRNA synthetase [Verrucomicrobiota bacterium]
MKNLIFGRRSAKIRSNMRIVILNQEEIAELDEQSPATERDGGYQGLLVELQRRVNRETGELELMDEHEEKIPRYAFDYGNGGWEKRLVTIFCRTLGPRLGRQVAEN